MEFDMRELDVVADVISLFEESGSTKATLEEFSEYLEDCDDCPLVYIGLGIAHLQQGKTIGIRLKKQILEVLQSENLNQRFQDEKCYLDFLEWKENFKKEVEEGRKTVKQKKPRFYPKFYAKVRVGDIYAYRMKEDDGTLSDRWGLYRVLEKEDDDKDLLVYLMCMPDFTIPENGNLEKLIYLPCSIRWGKFDYVYRLFRGDENTEETGRLKFVGNYPTFSAPADEVKSPDPLLYGYACQDNMEVHFKIGLSILKRYNLWKY